MFDFLKRKKNSQSFETHPENINFKKESNYDKEDIRMREVVYFSTDKDCYTKTYIPERLHVIENPIENEYNSINSYHNLKQKGYNSFENKNLNYYTIKDTTKTIKDTTKTIKDTTKQDDVDILNDILDLYFDMINEKTQSIYSQIK